MSDRVAHLSHISAASLGGLGQYLLAVAEAGSATHVLVASLSVAIAALIATVSRVAVSAPAAEAPAEEPAAKGGGRGR